MPHRQRPTPNRTSTSTGSSSGTDAAQSPFVDPYRPLVGPGSEAHDAGVCGPDDGFDFGGEGGLDWLGATPLLDTVEADAAPPPPDPAEVLAADRAEARAIFDELDDAMGIGVFDLADGESAQRLLAGRTPQQMREIRAYYEERTGRRLEDDVSGQFGGADGNEMMANVISGMSLRDQLEHYETSESMENLLEHATPEQIQGLVVGADGTPDRSILAHLRDTMSEDAYMRARTQLFPSEAKDAVAERITRADGIFSDDEGAAMSAFAQLPLEERQALLVEQPDLVDFMSRTERERFERIATSDAAALEARMEQATSGLGTDDDSVGDIVEETGRLATEQRSLEEALATGSLTDEQVAEIEGRLAEIGDVTGLLEPDRDGDGNIRDNTFLGRLQDDVGDDELHGHLARMGVDQHEQSKQRVLDAVGTFSDDETAFREAFASLPPGERQALWDDPHVQAALTHLSAAEQAEVASFRDNNVLEMTQVRVDDANGLFGQDEAAALEAVLDLNATDREAFLQTDQYAETFARMDAEERAALTEVMETGALSVETGMTAAAGGWMDGTNEALMTLSSQQRSAEDAVQLRLGYVLSRDGRDPETPEEVAALARFEALDETFAAELDGDDHQAQLDALVAHTADTETDAYTGVESDIVGSGALERSTAEGRMTASQLVNLRAVEQMGPDGQGGGGLADLFTSTDETAQQAHQSQMAAHFAAMSDGEITESELTAHEALGETFGEEYAAMLAAQNQIVDVAATVASAVAMLAATIASGGTLGPAAAAFMAQYGTLVTSAGVAAATIGTKEVMGGDRYNTLGADGATDVGMAVVNTLSSNATGALGDRAVAGLSTQVPWIQAPLGQVSGEVLEQGMMSTLRAQAPGLVIKNTIDSTLGTVTGSATSNLMSEEFWNQDGEGMLDLFGDGVMNGIQGLPTDIATGVLTDGIGAAADIHAGQRISQGFRESGVDTGSMELQTLQQLSIAQYHADAGRLQNANDLLGGLTLPEGQEDAVAGAVYGLDPEIQAALAGSSTPDRLPHIPVNDPDAALEPRTLEDLQAEIERIASVSPGTEHLAWLDDNYDNADALNEVLSTHDFEQADAAEWDAIFGDQSNQSGGEIEVAPDGDDIAGTDWNAVFAEMDAEAESETSSNPYFPEAEASTEQPDWLDLDLAEDTGIDERRRRAALMADQYEQMGLTPEIQFALDPARRERDLSNNAHADRPEVSEADRLEGAQKRALRHLASNDDAAYRDYLVSVWDDPIRLAELVDSHSRFGVADAATEARLRTEIGVPGRYLDTMDAAHLHLVQEMELAAQSGDLASVTRIRDELSAADIPGVDVIEAVLIGQYAPDSDANDPHTQNVQRVAAVMGEEYRADPETLANTMEALGSHDGAGDRLSSYLGEIPESLQDASGAERAAHWAEVMRSRIPEDSPTLGLHDAEMLSTLLYTTNFYDDLNPVLRSRDPGQLAELLPFIEGAASGINSLPDANVDTRRRSDSGSRTMDRNFVNGGFTSDDAFGSTSQLPDLTQFGTRYMVDLQSSSGADVSDISAYGPVFGSDEGEAEVLLPPGARLQVMDAIQDGSSRWLNVRELRDVY